MNYFKNNKVLLLVIAALILVNFGLLYYGFIRKPEADHPMRPNKQQMLERTKMKLKDEVGFSEEQLKKYEELRNKHFDSLEPKFEELGKAKENFLNLLYQPDLSDSAI